LTTQRVEKVKGKLPVDRQERLQSLVDKGSC
jgi:hypothetical protein